MSHGLLTVLIAEDDPQHRATLVRLLTPLGVTCIDVEDGRKAADILRDCSVEIHLVVTDMRMPGGSGWGVVRAVREHRGLGLPIIMQTGEARFSDVIVRAAALGVPLIDKADMHRDLVPAVRAALRL